MGTEWSVQPDVLQLTADLPHTKNQMIRGLPRWVQMSARKGRSLSLPHRQATPDFFSEGTRMTTATATPKNQVAISLDHLPAKARKDLGATFGSFLDVASTATSRATHYNTKEEQEAATLERHRQLFELDRGIYGLSLLLPVMDYARQLGIAFFLKNARKGEAVLDEAQEGILLAHLVQELPPQRMLKMFGELRKNRINNARTRKLILRSLLSSKHLEWWAVKYRAKMKIALEHAWGKRQAGIVASILGKRSRSPKERRILDHLVVRYASDPQGKYDAGMEEIVGFIFGHERGCRRRLLKAYHEAKSDLGKGKGLPREVLEGIRSRYHPDRKLAEVLELTKATMTEGEKMTAQRSAKKAGVKIKFDPTKQDAVKLYLYAYEMGMTDEIREALKTKAAEAAAKLPVRYQDIGIVLDASRSMIGHHTQRLRPMASALATVDMLVAASVSATVRYAGGQDDGKLVRPEGDTSLAGPLIRAAQEEPEAIFLITDGYENAPAGRIGEVVNGMRRVGCTIPIHQLTPVMAAETGAIRTLSPQVPALPLSRPEAVGIAMIKSLMEVDVDRGIQGLARAALPAIGLEV